MSISSTTLNLQQIQYLKSATTLNELPADSGFECAFIGRSNCGKSSAINTITGIKGLARTSQTPGRTQMINLFNMADDCRLVDLPGYGYAKVPKVIKQRWEATVDAYLQTRECLKGLILIMDVRHPLKEIDQQVIAWATQSDVPLHILLSKSDKLNKNERKQSLMQVENALEPLHSNISVQLFSALKKEGVTEARQILNTWVHTNTQPPIEPDKK